MPCDLYFLAMRNSRSFRAEDHIIQFLIGFNEEFHGVVSQVLLMDPLPQINKVFPMVLQHERKICEAGTILSGSNITEDGTEMVNVVDSTKQFGRGKGNSGPGRGENGGNGNGRGRGNFKVCTHCGKNGHIVDNCYKKHGYPPNLSRGSSTHINQVEANGNVAAGSTYDDGNMTLTKEQYNNLIMLLEKNTSSALVNMAKGDWFLKHDKIDPIVVNLPNGNSITTSICGDVRIFKDFVIQGVLYLPKFEARRNLKRIDSASELNGLYYLVLEKDTSHRTSNAGLVSSIFTSKRNEETTHVILWQLRLGHLSHDRMQCISTKYRYIPNNISIIIMHVIPLI
ncbi:uncharacterized protein LOC131631619 [Vicia villosa]|uniref:uncharacterized protein LOC131631619 n=1 Tax=Vicia villosa TaxID=3911 RepID=UPI00273BC3BE|nr:uncharacterized protein LOC131631619 [Vicia villosa]